MTRSVSDIEHAEFLYSVYAIEDADGYPRWHVRQFRITKRTARRIYYVRRTDLDGKQVIGFVDRQAMEASGSDGSWARRTGGWWEPDARLYLQPPPLPGLTPNTSVIKVEVARLRREAADAHPDRGGSDEAFIQAHRLLSAARSRLQAATGEAA